MSPATPMVKAQRSTIERLKRIRAGRTVDDGPGSWDEFTSLDQVIDHLARIAERHPELLREGRPT